jgi:hypothetical protein
MGIPTGKDISQEDLSQEPKNHAHALCNPLDDTRYTCAAQGVPFFQLSLIPACFACDRSAHSLLHTVCQLADLTDPSLAILLTRTPSAPAE